MFQLHSEYRPTGDQPQAIEALTEGLEKGLKHQVLLSLSGLVEQPISELLLPVLACAVVALLMDAIFLPLLFRFGAEKARILGMILFVVIFAGCAGAGFLAGGAQQSPSLSVHALLLAIAVAAAAATAAFWTSYCLSQRIYAKKEL